MFVRIESHKDPSEYQLIDIVDIGSVTVTHIPMEPMDTVSGRGINCDVIDNYKQMIYDKFPSIEYFDYCYSNEYINKLLDKAELSDDDKDQFWKLFKEYQRIKDLHNDWMNKRQQMCTLAPFDDPFHVYKVYLKGATLPIYTTMSTVDTLNKVLCNLGVDTNVCNDNGQATPTCK